MEKRKQIFININEKLGLQKPFIILSAVYKIIHIDYTCFDLIDQKVLLVKK